MTTVVSDAELRWRADENCREMFRILARGAAPRGAIQEIGGACLIATGVPIPLFNPAFLPHGGDVDALLFEARGWFRAWGVPWALAAAEHCPPAGRARLREAGLLEQQTMPVLTHPTLPGENWPAANAAVTVRQADTPEGIADHRALLALAFGIPEHLSKIVLSGTVACPLLRFYVAYRDGAPVGSAALCEAAGLAGIYNVAAHPERRREGIATTLLHRLLHDARERGLETCALQSSTAGVPLYARLRFRRLSTYTIYVDSEDPTERRRA